ncbi:hypothetical protein ACQEV9_00040 [Streptomyces chartreusis]|uniref:hypothetical protein n=1 Tax=Streptomyces chartreusis TaxID=1969 RepID=UPI003D906D4B
MQKRSAALIAASAAAVAVTVTGVTYASADSPQSGQEGVRPASAPLGGDSDYEYKDGHGYKKDSGEIQVNERTYSEDPGACVAVVRPAGAGQTFNIFNNTDRLVEFFSANNCDGGEPTRVLPGESRVGIVGVPTSSFRVVDFRS